MITFDINLAELFYRLKIAFCCFIDGGEFFLSICVGVFIIFIIDLEVRRVGPIVKVDYFFKFNLIN